MPDSAFIRSIARAHGGAIALTSANISGGLSTLAVDEFKDLWAECAYVFDGGRLPEDRRGSTVVDLSLPGTFLIIRDGSARALVTDAAQKSALVERAC